MNTLLKDGMELANAVEKLEKEKSSDAVVIIAPPYTHLSKVKELLRGVKESAMFSKPVRVKAGVIFLNRHWSPTVSNEARVMAGRVPTLPVGRRVWVNSPSQ